MNKNNAKRSMAAVAGLSSLALVAGASFAPLSYADTKVAPSTTLKVGGYIKLDAISSLYNDGDLDTGNIGRDFYIPSTIPVGGQGGGRDLDFQARSSRINFKTTSNIEGQTLVSFVEIDFNAGPEGNERVSNSYQPRLRHAFFSYGKWLFGQTWSTFQDVSVLPETLDFIGPAEGTVFVRQAQVRYSRDNWQFSLENPHSTVIPHGQSSGVATDDNIIPDMVVRYSSPGEQLKWSVAGILRNLAYEDVDASIDESTMGYGISLSATLKVGQKDDLRVMLTGGSGLGRYLAVNAANGAGFNADGGLEAINSGGGMVSYRHFWSDKWRSNVSLAAFTADHDTASVSGGVMKSARSVHVNLLHSPIKSVTLGVELMAAERELENGVSGSMNRVQFSAKHDF